MEDYQTWGNRIGWLEWSTRSLSGHTTPHPQVGDELRCTGRSGRTMCFEFTEVTAAEGVRDMWFGTVKDLGYLED